jgi:adenylate cyclase class IV
MEVEIKVPLEGSRLADLEKTFDRGGISLAEPETQRDVYFQEKRAGSKPEAPGSCLIRVRHSKGEALLTVKRLYRQGGYLGGDRNRNR